MGRKKRRLVDDTVDEGPPLEDMPISVPPVVSDPRIIPTLVENIQDQPERNTIIRVKEDVFNQQEKQQVGREDAKEVEVAVESEAKPLKSGYAMTSHSAEVIDEDIYISEGSEDEEDEEDVALRNIEMVLAGSRMGIMRRGIHHPMLVQPNRQWVKDDAKSLNPAEAGTELDQEAAEQKRLREQEEELAKLDPAQRAARLLAEKQRKIEEAKVNARRLESEENAGRDPCLFSKRTAFDIRFDQIDDKPWIRGGDMTDFFNYGLTEEDWLEYAQQQLMIRQELTDATRQRRPPDPTIVPVTPRAPSQQAPKVAVTLNTDDGEDGDGSSTGEHATAKELGPVLVKKDADTESATEPTPGPGPDKPETKVDVPVLGGAWGAGAAPGSMLAKLIEEQEQLEAAGIPSIPMEEDSKYGPAGVGDSYHDDQQSMVSRSEMDYNHGDDHASVRSSHSAQQDWNGGAGYYGGGGQQWDQYGGSGGNGGGGGGGGFRGGRGGGGRGQYGGRGGVSGGGRGGRGGGFRDNRFQGRGPGGFQDGGGDQYRKRPRDDYSESRGGGGWRR